MPLSTPSPQLYAQHGQALPLGLAFIAAAALLMLVVFNTGKIVSEKARVVNTADAAVYSGLVWQARSLNFQAYTNRAMVANQVSIAQLVSLGSWTNYGRISSRNLDTAIGWIPVVAPFTGALLQAMTQIETVVQNAAKVAIPIVDSTNTVLSVVQEGVYNASYVATPEVISAVVTANDTRHRTTSTFSIAANLRNAEAWQSLTSRHSGEDTGMARKADVISSSRDDFSTNRGWNGVPGIPGPAYVTPIDRFKIYKEGATELTQNGAQWAWRGKDGLSVHWEHYKCNWKGCRWKRKELPMGWGSTFAEGDGACNGGNCSNWFSRNGTAEQLADSEAEDLGNGYTGVKAYRSLKNLSRANRDPRLLLQVEVDIDHADVRTAEEIRQLGSAIAAAEGLKHGSEPGMFHTDDSYAKDSIASISAGEVYFKRPVLNEAGKLRVENSSGRRVQVNEYANLFNPYWDVRLVNVEEAQRQLAWATRSPGLSLASTATAAQDGALDLATTAAFDAADGFNGSFSDQTAANRNTFIEIGNQAIATLQGDFIEDAIKDAALGALTSAAENAVSNYASSNGFGDVYNTAAEVLEDGEINSADLSNAARRAVDNSTVGGALAGASELADGLLENTEGLADTLLASAGVADAVDRITTGLQGQAAALGDELKDSIGEIFATELAIGEQLSGLQNTIANANSSLGEEVDETARQLREQATDALNAELDQLEENLQDTLGMVDLDRDSIVDAFTGELDAVAQDLVNESTDAINTRIEDLQAQITDRFGALEITPETVRANVFEGANTFIGEQAESFQGDINQGLSQMAEEGASLLNEQLQTTVIQAREYAQEQARQLVEQQKNGLTQGLPDYE